MTTQTITPTSLLKNEFAHLVDPGVASFGPDCRITSCSPIVALGLDIIPGKFSFNAITGNRPPGSRGR
jgi:hypothetical protein